MVNGPGPAAVSDFCSTLTWWAIGPSGPFSEPTSCPVQPRALVRLLGTVAAGPLTTLLAASVGNFHGETQGSCWGPGRWKVSRETTSLSKPSMQWSWDNLAAQTHVYTDWDVEATVWWHVRTRGEIRDAALALAAG